MNPEPQHDPERYAGRFAAAGAVALVAGIVLGDWYGGLVALAGTVLLIFACRSREGFLLFGPFVRSELIRAARTRRLALWRFIYAAAAASMMFFCFSRAVFQSSDGGPMRGLERATETFFFTFAAVQFVYLSYLTIALIAPIVAEEREAKRWDFLLATDLRAREILIGKAVGRLPQILDPILAALPILVLSTLFGGVSPRLVLAVSVATLAMIFGTAGIAFFFSIFAPTAKMANERTSGMVFAYVAFSGLFLLFMGNADVWNYPTSFGVSSPIEFADVAEAVSIGNPIAVVVFAVQKKGVGLAEFEPAFESGVRKFVAFQIGVFCLFGLTAMRRMRAAIPWKVPEKQKAADGEKGSATRTSKPRPTYRPPIGEMPVYWLERYGQLTAGQMKFTNFYTPLKYVVFGILAASILIAARVADDVWPDSNIRKLAGGGVRICVWIFALLSLMPPAVRATRCVARERSADTLDGLLLTHLTPREILFEKWLGSATADAPIFWVSFTLSVAGAVTGFLSPLAPMAILITVPIYTAASAAVGLYFSVRAATPAKAMRNLVLVSVGFFYVVGSLFGAFRNQLGYIIAFPPAAIGVALIPGIDERTIEQFEYVQATASVVLGLAFYSAIGWLAWRFAVKRFEKERHN